MPFFKIKDLDGITHIVNANHCAISRRKGDKEIKVTVLFKQYEGPLRVKVGDIEVISDESAASAIASLAL